MGKESDIRTAVLISGGGSTAEAFLNAWDEGMFDQLNPVLVISSNPDAGGLEKAGAFVKKTGAGIDVLTLNRKAYGKEDLGRFGFDLMQMLDRYGVDLVSQNGWLPLTPLNVVKAFNKDGRMITNQHPGPNDPGRAYDGRLFSEICDQLELPQRYDVAHYFGRSVDFGGYGMFGERVTAARLAYAWATGDVDELWTESTMHFVTEKFDEGKLIRVAEMRLPGYGSPVTIADMIDDPSTLIEMAGTLQQALIQVEHQNVLTAMREIDQGNVVDGFYRDEPLIPVGKIDPITEMDYRELAIRAKAFVIDLYRSKK